MKYLAAAANAAPRHATPRDSALSYYRNKQNCTSPVFGIRAPCVQDGARNAASDWTAARGGVRKLENIIACAHSFVYCTNDGLERGVFQKRDALRTLHATALLLKKDGRYGIDAAGGRVCVAVGACVPGTAPVPQFKRRGFALHVEEG